MGETTHISWADSTLNFWEGCQETGSQACIGCYAKARNLRYAPKGTTEAPNWGPHAPRREIKSWRSTLRKISRLALAANRPWFVFVNSLSDFWDNQADPALRREAIAAMAEHPHLTFLLLTKRPQNIVKQFREAIDMDQQHDPLSEYWPRNIAIGCTVVTPAEAYRDISHLKQAARVLNPAFTFVSMEPLAEAVDLNAVDANQMMLITGLDWVITGGETDQGQHKARAHHPRWFKLLRDQCGLAGIAFQHKQNGEWAHETEQPEILDGVFETDEDQDQLSAKGQALMDAGKIVQWPDMSWSVKVGKKLAGRTLGHVTHDARPEVRA
jgi:protein gp37